MKFKLIATAGVIAGLALSPAGRAEADAGDAIAGALIGGIIGHAIAKDQQKRQPQAQRTTRKAQPGISSAQRQQNRELQTALNYFGYPVGTPDGSIGPRSRTAISGYQATLGYPPTGQVTDYERNLLITAYHRAIAGGPQVAQVAASHPMGMKGMLLLQRDEMAGIPSQVAQAGVPPMVPISPMPVAPAAAAGTLMVAAPAMPEFIPAPVEAAVAATPSLPNFMGAATSQVSLASQCNKVGLMTNTNGGYVTSAAMTDPAFALSEQFCLARTYAMTGSEERQAKVAGFTPAQIAEQCAGFSPVLAEHVMAASMKTRDEVLTGVKGFILNSGMAPAQLSETAKVCLGVGYTTDSMDIALGSALVLGALGEHAYGELVGHHLSQGYGASKRPDLAIDWYEMGLDAATKGQAVFAPGMGDRNEVIRKAAYNSAGRAGELAPVAAALPQFAAVPQSAPQIAPADAAPTVAAAPLLATQSAPEKPAMVSAGKVTLSSSQRPSLPAAQ